MYDLTMKEEREELRQMIDSAVPERIRSSCTDHLLSTLTILDKQDAEIAALKAEVGYWKSKSADFGRSIDDLSDAHDAIVIERDRLREALTKAHDDLYLNEQDTMASYERINAIKAGMFAALSPEKES